MAGCVYGQGTLRRQAPESSTQDSDGNLKKAEQPAANKEIRGVVTLPDNTPAEQLVDIIAACPAFSRPIAVADSKGKFSISFDQQRQSDKEWSKECTLYASLEGYRSDRVGIKDAKIVIHPISSDPAGLTSSSDGAVSDSQRKAYHKAIDKASKQDWKAAAAGLQEVISGNPGYSSALLALGICLQNMGRSADAEKAYKQAAQADPKFALPLIRAAALDAASGRMEEALAQSQKAIELNPNAFPDAYSLNAIAAISTQNAAAAEKSARAGLALDTNHQYPELEYALGMVLSTKDDPAEGGQHLRKYLELSPNGPNIEAARNELAHLEKPAAAATQVAAANSAQAGGPAVMGGTSEHLPGTAALLNVNAPLLSKSDAYSCLESVLPAKFDPRGRPAVLDTIRVDIAVSGGKEIYGVADGKHFSSSAQREMLGYSFSTTGLFSSIARALIAANQFEITPAGEIAISGQSLLRYNFRSRPSTAGWTIAYGRDTGVAQEQGWFLIDGKSEILRRVFVTAMHIPANLKLAELSALIDYETETIAEHRVLLPSAARIQVREQSGIKHASLLSFDHCRAFGASSNVSFDDPSSDQIDKIINPAPLPQNVQILISLTSPVSRASALQSDMITATVAKAVTEKGHEVIKAGALIEGHLRLKQGEKAMFIQLDRVQTTSGWAPFYAQLVKVGSSLVEAQVAGTQGQMPAALLNADDNADLTEPDVPGVATIVFMAAGEELPAGTQMIWKTQPLSVEHKEALTPQLNTSMGIR